MGTVTAISDFTKFHFRGRPSGYAAVLALSFLLASCGGSASSSGGSGNPAAAPAITAFTATPTSINAGQTTTLSVTATNATGVVITDNQDSNSYNLPAAGGTQIVSPAVSTTYVATASGSNAVTATQSVSVSVAPITMTSLTVTPSQTVTGTPVTLTWASQNADYVVINSSQGSSPGRVAASGSISNFPPPTQTTTYTAMAMTNTGAQSAPLTATLTVNQINSFDGLTSDVAGGSTEDDIDPNGAVGTKQFMEYVNTSYQAYSKTPPYTPVWTSPQAINTPWPSSSPCSKVGSQGPAIQLDSVIIFDRLASRWVIAAKTTVQTNFNFCIAVSSTDDLTSPAFQWYAYSFPLDSQLQTNGNGHVYAPDWPKVGTWSDGYYAAMDLIDPDTKIESGVLACVFDRTNMLTNATPTPAVACYRDSDQSRFSNGIYLAHSLIPADVDGTTAPPSGRDEFMVSIQNPLNPSGTDGNVSSSTLNLWDFHVDWTIPALNLVALTTPAVDVYTPGCYTQANPGQTICVPEMGVAGIGGIQVDSVGDRFMPRFAYRNFANAAVPYESFLMSHTVKTNQGSGQDAAQTGIRWYEFRANGSGTPTVSQESTVTFDTTYYRYMPSIAQDKNGSVAIGYNISNPSSFPGISMAYWNLNPIGAGSPVEITILDAPGEEIPLTLTKQQSPNLGQWGSYATITVDPTDDCTFWYVNEYWLANTTGLPGPWSTNISYFQLPNCQ